LAKFNNALLAFNRGIVSDLALARVDLKRLALSAEEQVNFMPRALGPMMLRPGLEYIAQTLDGNAAEYIPFVFAADDTALIELTPGKIRVLVDEELVTRPSVTTTVSNPNFDTDLTGWTDADESGGTSVWFTGGYMSLTGNGTNAAIRKQTLTVAAGSQNVEHALNIETTQGLCYLRVGSTDGGDDYITETELGVGNHSLAFTPTGGSVYVQVFNRRTHRALINSIDIAPAGVMEISVPWVLDTFDKFRYDQSGDVIFVACETFQQKRIERRGAHSWSTVWYRPEDGPFRPVNITSIRMTPSAISGNITLTASKPYFKPTNVGSLFRITSNGQTVQASLTGEDQWTDPIRVTGVGAGRVFGLIIASLTGTSSTVTLQRSVEEPGAWTDVSSYTTNQSTTYNDGLDNQIIYYRIGIKTGNYSSGTIDATLNFSAGSISGVCRVTAYTSSTVVSAEVVENLGGTSSTADWEEGAWSERRGWPSAVCLHEGRLFWAGKDKIWGSVSDAFNSFDDFIEGDSGPINRSIGKGPVDTLSWMVSLNRLIIGGQGSEFSAQSSNTDEILTPTTFGLKAISSQGSKGVAAVKVDNSVLFVHRGGAKIYEANQADQFSQYVTGDITSMVPGIGVPGIVRIGVQRQPDTRLHCVRSDGTVAVLVYDSAEQVKCWVNVETDGWIESVVVLPGAPGEVEDRVYYVVLRTIDDEEVRFLEKWAFEEDCQGGTLNHQADSYVQINQASSATITGLSRLEGCEVVVWANGKDLGNYTVTDGSITVSEAVTSAIVGLEYEATFKSSKLAYTAALGTPLNQTKKVHGLGFVLKNTHYKGLQYGRDFDNMFDMPNAVDWIERGADTIYETLDQSAFDFEGDWDTDARVCLKAVAPRPCTILACTMQIQQNEG
jgi:hypothetical protein